MFLYIGGRSELVHRKKSKKMRSVSEEDLPNVLFDAQLQSSVDNSTVHHSSRHNSVSTTHTHSPTNLVNGQKNAKKKRNKIYSETLCVKTDSGDDFVSEAERQHQSSKTKSTRSSDSDHCAQSQIDQQLKSGIKLIILRHNALF